MPRKASLKSLLTLFLSTASFATFLLITILGLAFFPPFLSRRVKSSPGIFKAFGSKGLNCKLDALPGSAAFYDGPAVSCAHPYSKPVGFGPFSFFWLICSFWHW